MARDAHLPSKDDWIIDDLSAYAGQADLPVTGVRYYYRLPDEEECHYVEHDSSVIAWTALPREKPAIARRLWFLLQSLLHLLARLVAGAVALARDLCETAYASYPAEDGDELL